MDVHTADCAVACNAVVAGEGAVSAAAGVAAPAAAAAATAAVAAAPPDVPEYVLDWMESELAPAALPIHGYSLVSKCDYRRAMHMFLALTLQQLHPNWVRN